MFKILGFLGFAANLVCIYSFYFIGNGFSILSAQWIINVAFIVFFLIWSVFFLDLSGDTAYGRLILNINSSIFIYAGLLAYTIFSFNLFKEGIVKEFIAGAISSIVFMNILGVLLKIFIRSRDENESIKRTPFFIASLITFMIIILFIYKYLFIFADINLFQIGFELLFLALGLSLMFGFRYVAFNYSSLSKIFSQ